MLSNIFIFIALLWTTKLTHQVDFIVWKGNSLIKSDIVKRVSINVILHLHNIDLKKLYCIVLLISVIAPTSFPVFYSLSYYFQNVASDIPKIREFIVKTSVANRFAETSVLNKVENVDTYAKQTTFSVVLPEKAFISGFTMEIDGKIYRAFVKEKEEAERIYGQVS